MVHSDRELRSARQLLERLNQDGAILRVNECRIDRRIEDREVTDRADGVRLVDESYLDGIATDGSRVDEVVRLGADDAVEATDKVGQRLTRHCSRAHSTHHIGVHRSESDHRLVPLAIQLGDRVRSTTIESATRAALSGPNRWL